MAEILNIQAIQSQERWAEKLAELTRIAWTGTNGKCYFPYKPLTTAKFWQSAVIADWQAGKMLSWALLEKGEIVAHVALVKKDGYWELGRWVALPDASHGAVTVLCCEAMKMVFAQNLLVRVECTQAHSTSQFICERIGLRFAGIGILTELDGIVWDIIYFDNQDLLQFEPKAGVLGNPQGKEIKCLPEHRRRLEEISKIISSDRGGDLPPRLFHTLPHLVDPIMEIISLNR